MPFGDSDQRTFDLAAVETRLRIDADGRHWTVDREHQPLTFGRDADNALVVGDRLASRHHGRVVYRDGRFHLTDDSRNGTLVISPAGATQVVHRETIVLHGAGTVRLGHHDGAGFTFVAEIRAGAGQPWQSSADEAGNLFRRDGDVWTIRYAGGAVRLKDARGLRYLAALLRRPSQELHVLDLVLVGPDGELHSAVAPTGGSDGAGPVLDAQAREAYRRRLSELRDEVDDAERLNDIGRAEHAREELAAVAGALAGAVGLGGRDREAASNAERCRVAVTRRIKDAVARIAANDPALGEHLAASVHTGRFCSYRPGAARPVTWTF